MKPILRNLAAAPALHDPSQETVAGLHAVVMLGSFMHAAPSSEDTAELSVGGLSALTRLPLAAVAWYADGADRPLRIAGRCSGEPGVRPGINAALREVCAQLPAVRPSRLAGAELPSELRLAGAQVLLALPLRVSTECLGFLLAGGPKGTIPADLTVIQALGAQTSTALYVARLQETEATRLHELGHLAGELREQGELLSRVLRLQEELIDLVLRGNDARTIVDHLARQIGAPVWLLDGERHTIAHAPGDDGHSRQLPRESELRRVLTPHHPDRDPRTVTMTAGRGVQPFLVQTVATDRDTFGYLLVGSTALGPVDHTTFQCGRLVLALRLLIERSVAEAEERAGRDLLQDVLLHRSGALTSAALAVRLGYSDDGPAALLAVRTRPRDGDGARAQNARRRAASAVREDLQGTRRALV
ncbi:MAG: diguanylate phosphodiesterase, partial [Pseudonocardia sp.]|nr:diguanylate phosphodiesterase [Pseudonocardia sp.]